MRLFALVKSMIAEQTARSRLQDALRELLKGRARCGFAGKIMRASPLAKVRKLKEKPAAIHCARLGSHLP